MNNQTEMLEDLVKEKNPVLETLKTLLEECAASKDPHLIEATARFMAVCVHHDFI